jgi:hypothetical protein
MSDEEFRECQFIDGLYQSGNPECETCFLKIRSACRVFSVYNGLRESEYYLSEDKTEIEIKESRQSSLAEKIKRVKKEW